jgi:hypothetical protein
MPPIKIVPLRQIRRDVGVWPRKQLSRELVQEFAELYRFHNPESIEPIIVAPAGPDGLNLLLDGWHRVAGAEEAGLEARERLDGCASSGNVTTPEARMR